MMVYAWGIIHKWPQVSVIFRIQVSYSELSKTRLTYDIFLEIVDESIFVLSCVSIYVALSIPGSSKCFASGNPMLVRET